ncbi:MAG: TldD/PmbA family protein [Nannocystaceae bacterium]
MPNNLLVSAQDAVAKACKAGADDAWVNVSRERSVSFSYRDGNMEKVEESTSRGLSLRVYVDGRYSAHGTTDLRPDHLHAFIREAVELTRALQPDPHRTITDPALFADRADIDLELLDPDLAALNRDRREQWCREMDARAHDDARVISAECSVFSGESKGVSASSNGFVGTSAGGYVGYSTSVTVREDGDKRPEGMDYAVGRFLGTLPHPTEIAGGALRKALSRIGSAKAPTQRTNMVVDPQAAVSLLARTMGPASAAAIQQKRSFWAGQQGKRLFGARLTVRDNPLIARGLASRLFDGEGISAKPRTIIEEGVVRNFYVDTYYGRKAGMTPTTGSPSNRIVTCGAKPLAELIKDVGNGIYVTSWLGGNSDPTTGDFSLGLRGHLIVGGEIATPVGEMNVTGNLANLWERLMVVGNDPYPYSSVQAPTLVFGDVQFSGS